MRTHWLVQSSGLRRTDAMITSMLEGIEKGRCTWCDFGVIPFTNEITNWENFPLDDSVDYMLHCSIKVLRIFCSDISPTEIFPTAPAHVAEILYAKIKKAIFYDEQKFDMANYARNPAIKHFLLNGECEIYTVREMLTKKFDTLKFIKPGKDLKLFNGELLAANMTLEEHLKTRTTDVSFNDRLDEKVIVAEPQNVIAEWRFFIQCSEFSRNVEVIGGSQYKPKVDAHFPMYIMLWAEYLAAQYQPAKAFVMDLGMTDKMELKIIEYNCINCSGLYASNVQVLAEYLKYDPL